MKQHWEQLLDSYLRTRECLRGLILIMDIRHPLKDFDKQLLAWSSECEIPVHILLNKSDKLSTSAIKQTLRQVSEHVTQYPNQVTVQTFSVLKSLGINDLRTLLDGWFTE